jgi:hypothetical protein
VSFKATAALWALRDAMVQEGVASALEGSALLVALALADRAIKVTGELRVGLRGISRRTGLHYSTVHAAIRELVGAGMLEVVKLGGGARPTHYRLVIVGAITNNPVENDQRRSPGRSLLETQRSFNSPRRAGEPRAGARVSRAEPVPVYKPEELRAHVDSVRVGLKSGRR